MGLGPVDGGAGGGRAADRLLAQLAAAERALKRTMYAKLYHHPRQLEVAEKATRVVAGLAEAYLADPALLPEHWRAGLPDDALSRMRLTGDFIAGMTDRYALARYREVVGPIALPGAA